MKIFSASEIQSILSRHYGKEAKRITPLVGEKDQNVYVKTEDEDEYILKIAHPDHHVDHLHMENGAMEYLLGRKTGLLIPKPVHSVRDETIVDLDGQPVRLIRWLSGRLWHEVNPVTDALLFDVGRKIARLHKGLQGYDHAVLHRQFNWDPSAIEWVAKEKDRIFTDPKEAGMIDRALDLIAETSTPHLDKVPKGVCYLDANDHNIIIGGNRKTPHVLGFIDFGDMVWTHRINELAIAIAYTCMQKPDPLTAACEVVRGFASEIKLEETELKVLYGQIIARYVISLAFSTLKMKEDNAEPYSQVSAMGAWKMVHVWPGIHPSFAESCFRYAAGLEPHPNHDRVVNYLKKHRENFFPILGPDVDSSRITVFDWSIGSADLGSIDQMHDVEASTHAIFRKLEKEGSSFGIGRYDEPRPVYTSDAFVRDGNNGPEWRTIHIGLDLFLPPGSPVFAPLDGEVVICCDNAKEKEYGPLLVLKHRSGDVVFYTLYGHNDPEVLDRFSIGQKVRAGDRIALVGDYPENGNWVPHLHFQLMTDLLGYANDFPGVAFPTQRAIWKSISPDPNLMLGFSHPLLRFEMHRKPELLNMRKGLLGQNLSLSYREPLYIQRGYMQHLYDELGQKYLDTVNNVAHVGHQHPAVVQAMQRQAGILNTNTRYLHEEILYYAEELLDILPGHLEVVYFVNSGSEANELALRMAKTITGKDGILALDHGYHGNTGQLVDISAYKFNGPGGIGIGYDANTIHVPDLYRDPSLHDTENTKGIYRDLFRLAWEELEQEGTECAALIHESILSCGGQVVLPPNFLIELYEEARELNMVTIADEVQTGLGRVGSHWWAFELAGIEPDIVTMGKPIGNGFPIGAVATTRQVAEGFANGMEYFNTFGGNPLSCVVGRSVLSVLREEGLRDKALESGEFLKQGLSALKPEYPVIGDVRGEGLFLGVELVTDPVRKTHARMQTKYLVNRLKETGILSSSDGPYHNVIKIKPPMCFSRKDAQLYMNAFERILDEDYMQL